MTETDDSPCSFVDEKRVGQRICTARDFARNDCSKKPEIKVNTCYRHVDDNINWRQQQSQIVTNIDSTEINSSY